MIDENTQQSYLYVSIPFHTYMLAKTDGAAHGKTDGGTDGRGRYGPTIDQRPRARRVTAAATAAADEDEET